MTASITGWKVLTSGFRPPLKGGEPVWDGTVDAVLPKVWLDRSSVECAPGWNFCLKPETTLRIGGMWSDGRPSVLLKVETVGDHVVRGDKCRAESLRILGVADDERWLQAVTALGRALSLHTRPRWWSPSSPG